MNSLARFLLDRAHGRPSLAGLVADCAVIETDCSALDEPVKCTTGSASKGSLWFGGELSSLHRDKVTAMMGLPPAGIIFDDALRAPGGYLRRTDPPLTSPWRAFKKKIGGSCKPLVSLMIAIAMCRGALCQNTVDSQDGSNALVSRRNSPPAQPVESELIFEGMASYGHYTIFASGSGDFLYTAGVEYDRHSWGRLLGARFDYVAELLPVVLLREGNKPDIWGTPQAPGNHMVPGLGFSPIGFRLLWRDGRILMPYLEAKYGMIGFTEKALSEHATYENFSMQSATGIKVRLKDRWDARLGLFSDFHFSDAFIVPVNPGLDVMSANLGIVYHLHGPRVER
jgi:Lipid A 3-O-deacylase (PagL)